MQAHNFIYDQANLKYYTAGSAQNPPIIFVHGYTCSHHSWRQTIPALEEHFYCVAIDLLGHGESDILPDGDYSIEAQAKRVLALVDQLGCEHFTLIGHSMGGQIALYIAAILAPERVTKLVDVDGVASAHFWPDLEKQLIQNMDYVRRFPFLVTIFRWLDVDFRWGAGNQFSTWFYDFNAMPFEDWRIDRQLVNQPGMHITWYHSLHAILDLDLTPHLSKISAPTLIIFGKHDAVIPPSDGELVKQHIPDSQLIMIDNCGHFPMFEATETYLQALREFLL